MKKILSTIFALAMIFVFVSCDPINGSGNDNVVQLPDPIGEDPFFGVEKLVSPYYDEIEYIVDSKTKTITVYGNAAPATEYVYSYKVDDKEKILYMVLTSIFDEGVKKPVKGKDPIFTYKICSLDETGEDAVYSISTEGIYDESKEWYDQINGYFYDDKYYEECGVFIYISNTTKFIGIDNKEFIQITEINDSEIVCEIKGEKVEFPYTKTNTGKDTIITLVFEEDEVNLIWTPHKL